MKKGKIVLSILAAAGLALTATSCHDNIYALIEQEVPKQTGLDGDINEIVPFNGYLYVANGYLYRKALEESSEGKYNYQWSKVDAVAGGTTLNHITRLAADDSYLYCYTIEYKEDVDTSVNVGFYKRLYCSSDGESWTEIDITSITGLTDSYSISPVVLFDNQVGNGSLTAVSGRNAYARLRGDQEDDADAETNACYKIYKLSGTSFSVASFSENSTADVSIKVVNFGGSDFPIKTYAATSNDHYTYYAAGSSIVYTEDQGTTSTTVALNSGTIYSLAAAADYLLVGTSSGIYRVQVGSSGALATSVSDFDNNAQTLLTSRIPAVYVLDSTKNEGETDEYASLAIYGYLSSSSDSFDETGLYAYYPGRGNWNRDGEAE